MRAALPQAKKYFIAKTWLCNYSVVTFSSQAN